MLQKLDRHIRECYEYAAENAALARTETDEGMRAKLLRLERTWTHLAKSYEFVQTLEAFLLDASKTRVRGNSPDATSVRI